MFEFVCGVRGQPLTVVVELMKNLVKHAFDGVLLKYFQRFIFGTCPLWP